MQQHCLADPVSVVVAGAVENRAFAVVVAVVEVENLAIVVVVVFVENPTFVTGYFPATSSGYYRRPADGSVG